MYNWSVNTKILRENPEQYIIWKLEQAINFGLRGKKLNSKLIKKYWDQLHLDPKRREVLAFWLWEKLS